MTSCDPGSPSILAPEDAIGTPIDSPLTGLPPALFRDGENLTFQYATDPCPRRRVLYDYLESSP